MAEFRPRRMVWVDGEMAGHIILQLVPLLPLNSSVMSDSLLQEARAETESEALLVLAGQTRSELA